MSRQAHANMCKRTFWTFKSPNRGDRQFRNLSKTPKGPQPRIPSVWVAHASIVRPPLALKKQTLAKSRDFNGKTHTFPSRLRGEEARMACTKNVRRASASPSAGALSRQMRFGFEGPRLGGAWSYTSLPTASRYRDSRFAIFS